VKTASQVLPRDQWQVLIHDHHEGYLTRQQYLDIDAKLAANRTNAGARPPREGPPLCQGISPGDRATDRAGRRGDPGRSHRRKHDDQRHRFWLGTGLAGQEISIWADTTVVHLLGDGVRLKSVPSRFTLAQLQQLLVGGGRAAGPPPIASAPARRSSAVEVDRTISACGLLGLAGRQHPVGYHLAGSRVTARLDHGVLHLLDHDRTVLRSLPNPLTSADLARLRDALPASPAPAPATSLLRVDRRISSRGSISLAGQWIQVGSVTPAARPRWSRPTPPSGSTAVPWSRSTT
jgi:hypothetical protein